MITVSPPELVGHRLARLYEIFRLFGSFEDVEKTFDTALALTSKALPLLSAIVIDEAEGPGRMVVWPSANQSVAQMDAAKSHAQTAYAYFVGPSSADAVGLHEQAGRTPLPRQATARGGDAGNRFIVIPLVVARRPVFGAIQLEGAGLLDKADLVFVTAIANQLAVALDRRAIRHQLSFTRALATSLGEGLVAVDLDGRIVFINRATEELLGWQEQAPLGKRFRDLIDIVTAEGGSAECPLERVLRSGAPVRSDDYVFVRRGGKALPVSCSCAVVRLAETTAGAVMAFQDISERKQVEEALRQAVRSREQVLQTVSHDLKNPLGVIQIVSGTMLADAPPHDRRLKQRIRIETIDRAARRMRRLIDDLVDFSSIEAGQLELMGQAYDPEPLVQEAVTSFQELALEKQLILTGEVASEISFIDCDRDRVLQVLGNLIGNAVKATEAGSIVLRAEGRGSEVLFTVQDTGPGIPAEELDQIFERYRRGKRPGYAGTGLGLAISRGIVGAHGGRIWAESTIGVGSAFFFTIPAAGGGR